MAEGHGGRVRVDSGRTQQPLETDLLVIGGGGAGTAAAIAAGRRGASVILVEAGNCLGGTATAGLVATWFASTEGLGDMFDEFNDLLDKHGALHGGAFDAEVGKFVWQRMAQEAGVRILFHAMPIAVDVDAGRVREVEIACRADRLIISPKFVVDASGEGDLAALAGAEFHKGDPEAGRTLHMSLIATMYDTGKPVTPFLPPGLEPIESDDELPGFNGPGRRSDGSLYVSMTKVMGHDPTDPFSLSDAELEARDQLARIVHYLQRTKCPTHVLASTGSRIGIREGRRVVGDYVITEDDVLGHGTDFEDGVTVATCQIDFHSLTRAGSVGWRKRITPYAIPFRALTAKGFANLLVAGKCISGDQVAQSSYRMTPTCIGMGQAVGTAAAMAAAERHTDIRQLSVAGLRTELARAGVELDPSKHVQFPPDDRHETPDRDGRR